LTLSYDSFFVKKREMKKGGILAQTSFFKIVPKRNVLIRGTLHWPFTPINLLEKIKNSIYHENHH